MGRIIDIPLHPVEVPAEKRCIHLNLSNERCTLEAVMQERCDIHYNWFSSQAAAMGVAFPEDSISLQAMLMKVADMVITGRVDHRKAKSLVEICKLRAQNVRAFQRELRDAHRETKGRLAAGRVSDVAR